MTFPRLTQRLAYPALYAGNAAAIVYWTQSGVSLVQSVSQAILCTLGYLLFLESVLPHKKAWQPNSAEALRDGVYLGVNMLLGSGARIAAAALVAAAAPHANHLSLALSVPFLIVLNDLSMYCLHRFSHRGWLWRCHGIHHQPDKVNVLNDSATHGLDTLLFAFLTPLPGALLGFSPEAITLAAFVGSVQALATHANVEVELGPLSAWIMTPSHHRVHHDVVPERAGNYGLITTLWDRVFGTFTDGRETQPARVGCDGQGFPSALDVVASQLHPFRAAGPRGARRRTAWPLRSLAKPAQ